MRALAYAACSALAVAIAAATWVKPARAHAVEPTAAQLYVVSAADMARICREHGVRPNCRGMAAWDRGFRQCIVWVTAGPDFADVLAHELRHCREGHFHPVEGDAPASRSRL